MFLSSIGLPQIPKTGKPSVLESPREIWLVRRPLRATIQTLKGNLVERHRDHVAPSPRSMVGAETRTILLTVFTVNICGKNE